jgi:alpha-ketoglutaric semialdehyde dehydrogenase
VATLRSHDPSDPERLLFEVEELSGAGVSARLDAALEAWPGWWADAVGRAAALGRLAEEVADRRAELAAAMVAEVGKPRAEAGAEVDRAVGILRYYAQVALDPTGETLPGSSPGARVVVEREPRGVVLAICPWNFPLAIPIWKAAPALAYGNAVLLKPAGQALAVGDLLRQAAAAALPAGVFDLLALSGAGLADAHLLDDRRVAAVTFTGSTGVGLGIATQLAARAAPAQMEMGGQNAAIVLPDADLERAAEAIVSGAMSYAGQKCTATRRAIAVGEIAEPLTEALVAKVEALRVGPPGEEGVQAGPLIDAPAAREFESNLAAALAAGARELARAEAPEGPGHFVSPALLGEDDPAAAVNAEETFGPLLTVLRVADEEAAVRAANATEFGLVGAVHGADLTRAARVASGLECGMRRVNAPTPGVDYYAPFGGEGLSGYGPREQGRAAREFFTAAKTTTIVPPAG